MRQLTLLQAIREFLMLPGETLKAGDFRALTPDDKEGLKRDFAAMDIEIVAQKVASA